MSSLVCNLTRGTVGDSAEQPWGDLTAGPQQRMAILRRYRRVAMVGLSANPMRPSHFAATYLANRGFDLIPVNPGAERILGRRCFPDLPSIDGPVEIVDIFRPPRFVPAIVEDAIGIGAKVVWMQFGVVHEDAARRALDAGLEVVMDQGMKVEHARFFGGLTGLGLNGGVVSARAWSASDGLHRL